MRYNITSVYFCGVLQHMGSYLRSRVEPTTCTGRRNLNLWTTGMFEDIFIKCSFELEILIFFQVKN